MNKNSNNIPVYEDEISLIEFIELLSKSKLMIILITLSITICSIIYSALKQDIYHSEAIIEIGVYGNNRSDLILIEPTLEASKDLRRLFIFNNEIDISKKTEIESLEDKLIRVKYHSTSVEENNKFFSDISDYLSNKHRNIINAVITSKKKNSSKKINQLERDIEFEISKINSIKSNIALLDSEINNAEESFQLVDTLSYITALNDLDHSSKLHQLNESLFTENIKLEELDNLIVEETLLVKNKVTIEKPNYLTQTLLGFLVGLVISIFTVLLIRFKKNFPLKNK